MLRELDIKNWSKVKQLFESHILARSIINPCAQAEIGSLIVDDADSPSVATYSTPMMVFLAGDSRNYVAKEIIRSLPPLITIIAPDENWNNLLKNEWGGRLVVHHRTHLDPSTLDVTYLRKLKEILPEGYTLNSLDLKVSAQINQEYTIQIQMYFGKIENLIKTGIGFCILDEMNKLVSYAYTPFPFIDEFEIQVYTENSPKYRRRGLATIVSAALIQYGLERGFVPHWDAANESSTNLALKLGYSSPKTWEAYYYTPQRE